MPHLVPRQVVLHRPTSEMSKQAAGSGFTSLLLALWLASSWASQIGKRGKGVSSLKSPDILTRVSGAGWEIYQSLLYHQVVGDFDPELDKEALQPHSFWHFPYHLHWEPSLRARIFISISEMQKLRLMGRSQVIRAP